MTAKRSWKQLRHLVGKIHHVKDDWLTPIEYLPLINNVLGEIDLDPCSTHDANQQFLQARKIYTLADDGLNMEEPGKVKPTFFLLLTVGALSAKNEVHGADARGGSHGSTPSVICSVVCCGNGNLETFLRQFSIPFTLKCFVSALKCGTSRLFPKRQGTSYTAVSIYPETTYVLGYFCTSKNGVRFNQTDRL